MASSLASLVDNLSEGLHKDKCIDCQACLDFMMFKDDQLIFRCFDYKKNYKKDFNKDLIKRFASTYEFWNKDIDKCILLLRKIIYPHEYMDSWERFDEQLLPEKDAFYSSLSIEDITNVDYRHAKRVYKKFSIKNWAEYHNLYVQNDTLLLADVFENFRDMRYNIYDLDPAYFFICTWISMARMLKKTGVKLE